MAFVGSLKARTVGHIIIHSFCKGAPLLANAWCDKKSREQDTNNLRMPAASQIFTPCHLSNPSIPIQQHGELATSLPFYHPCKNHLHKRSFLNNSNNSSSLKHHLWLIPIRQDSQVSMARRNFCTEYHQGVVVAPFWDRLLLEAPLLRLLQDYQPVSSSPLVFFDPPNCLIPTSKPRSKSLPCPCVAKFAAYFWKTMNAFSHLYFWLLFSHLVSTALH